jgi:hypothetical protein
VYVAIVFVLTSTGATLDITANGAVIGHIYLQKTLPLNNILTTTATAITPVIHIAVIRGSRSTLISNSLKPQRSITNATSGRPQLLSRRGNFNPMLNLFMAPAIAPTGQTAHHHLPARKRLIKIIGYQNRPDSDNVIKFSSEDSGPIKPSYMNTKRANTKNSWKDRG